MRVSAALIAPPQMQLVEPSEDPGACSSPLDRSGTPSLAQQPSAVALHRSGQARRRPIRR
jgi:hypothetical protein